MERKCVICDNIFETKYSRKLICSPECKKVYCNRRFRKYYRKNKKIFLKRSRKHYLKNREKYREYFKENFKKWYKEHGESEKFKRRKSSLEKIPFLIPEELKEHETEILKCWYHIFTENALSYFSRTGALYAICQYLNKAYSWGYSWNKIMKMFRFKNKPTSCRRRLALGGGNKLYKRMKLKGVFPSVEKIERILIENGT